MQDLQLTPEISISVAEQEAIIARNEEYDSKAIEEELEALAHHKLKNRTPIKFHVIGLDTDNPQIRGSYTGDEDWWV